MFLKKLHIRLLYLYEMAIIGIDRPQQLWKDEMKIIQYKICLLGDFAVGKTSLVRRFVTGRFDDRYLSTIGVKIARKSLEQEGTEYQLLLWDLAGGDRFFQYQNSYLSGTAGAIIVMDLTRQSTLGHLADYIEQVNSASPEAGIVCVGNKLDLVEEREVNDEEIQKVSELMSVPCLLASAKTGDQVEAIFQAVLGAIHAKRNPNDL